MVTINPVVTLIRNLALLTLDLIWSWNLVCVLALLIGQNSLKLRKVKFSSLRNRNKPQRPPLMFLFITLLLILHLLPLALLLLLLLPPRPITVIFVSYFRTTLPGNPSSVPTSIVVDVRTYMLSLTVHVLTPFINSYKALLALSLMMAQMVASVVPMSLFFLKPSLLPTSLALRITPLYRYLICTVAGLTPNSTWIYHWCFPPICPSRHW